MPKITTSLTNAFFPPWSASKLAGSWIHIWFASMHLGCPQQFQGNTTRAETFLSISCLVDTFEGKPDPLQSFCWGLSFFQVKYSLQPHLHPFSPPFLGSVHTHRCGGRCRCMSYPLWRGQPSRRGWWRWWRWGGSGWYRYRCHLLQLLAQLSQLNLTKCWDVSEPNHGIHGQIVYFLPMYVP